MNSDQPVDLSNVPNPFDFANPVSRKELFAGRKTELKDIEYYLDHARQAPRSINLALLGERASGKTSLLNIIEDEAIIRKLVPVRIDLNESDVDTHFAFWFKVFDSILTRVVTVQTTTSNMPAFGGESGGTYDTYLDLISTYIVPGDKTFCPFLFPIQYAKAMSVRNSDARVSDQILKRDLQIIANEVGRPIVLLIDECNILSPHRALLEMIRNTFMNLKGFMLVFTGTPDLFPVMDEVFSPIVRQFKKINVTPFAAIADTVEAIREPLKLVRMENLFRGLERYTHGAHLPLRFGRDDTLQELHELTGGRPFEIQLVCHFMFRRIQQNKATRMMLSLDVLEDVLRELKQRQDVDARPVISAVRSLDCQQLDHLGALIRAGGSVPVTELSFALRVTGAIDIASEGSFLASCVRFVDLGILRRVGESVRFAGDDFDRIVCKYAARQRSVHLSFETMSFQAILEGYIEDIDLELLEIDEQKVAVSSQLFSVFRDLDDLPEAEAREKLWSSLSVGDTVCDVYRKMPQLVGKHYSDLMGNGADVLADTWIIRVDVTGAGAQYLGLFGFVTGGATDGSIDRLLAEVEEMARRARRSGGELRFDRCIIKGTPCNELIELIISSGDERGLRTCTTVHCERACEEYSHDRALALRHAICALPGIALVDGETRNNVGYVLLGNGELDRAEQVLLMSCGTERPFALTQYNRGIVMLQRGDRALAERYFRDVIRLESESVSNNVVVLLVAEIQNEALTFEERWVKGMRDVADSVDEDSISLTISATKALAVIDGLRSWS